METQAKNYTCIYMYIHNSINRYDAALDGDGVLLSPEQCQMLQPMALRPTRSHNRLLIAPPCRCGADSEAFGQLFWLVARSSTSAVGNDLAPFFRNRRSLQAAILAGKTDS